MGIALWPTMLLLSAGAGEVRPAATVGAGGGYDWNLNLAAAGQAAVDSAVVSGWASGGLAWDVAMPCHLYGGLRYDGAYYPSATDLTRNAAGIDLLWIQEFSEALALIVSTAGAYAWYGDPRRNGPGLLARGTLRVKPWDPLALRAGYGYSQRWASDPAFSTYAHRIFASVEARVARDTFLGVGYSWQSGLQTFYVSSPTGAALIGLGASGGTAVGTAASGPGGAGAGGPRPGTTGGSGSFENLVPYAASTTDSTIAANLEQGIWEGLYLFGAYAFTWGSSAEGSYTTQSAGGGVGYRF
jgi:hypothetical protein